MSDWSAGYVSDVEYVGSYYGDLAPPQIDFACLINGAIPPVTGGKFSYCELGCGTGMSTTVLAATHPEAEFYGVDFNPAHIARARVLCDEAGLENLTFLESGFDELVDAADPGLPMFDYVTMHGVYSWVGTTVRADIIRFLRRFLKPGGAAYVSYNAMPGWSLGVGVQRLILEIAARASGGAEQRVETAIRFADRLGSVDAGFLKENPYLKTVMETLATGDRRYLAHEYLNTGWQPLFFSDVAGDLAEAKLDYVGSTKIIENFLDLMLKPDQRSLVSTLDDRSLRELVKDFCTPRRLRRDVFVRGLRRMTAHEQELRLRDLTLVLHPPRAATSLTVQVPQGEATVNKDVYEPIFDALAEGPKTVGQLIDMDALRGHSDAKPAEVAGMLIGSGQALPASARPGSDAAAKRLNRALSYRARIFDTKAREVFAAPMLGTGLDAGMIDRLCYAAIADGVEPAVDAITPLVWEPIRARGESMNRDGRPVESEAENLEIVGEMVARFVNDRLPLLTLTGAL